MFTEENIKIAKRDCFAVLAMTRGRRIREPRNVWIDRDPDPEY